MALVSANAQIDELDLQTLQSSFTRKIMVLTQVLPSIVDGLLIGFVYGVAAMGLTLIWGVMRVINLGHGATMALGMFCTYFLFADLGVNPYLEVSWWRP